MTFKKGESGNPQGRPLGIPDKRTKLRHLLQPHGQELVHKAVELALDGDVNALRICLERLIPRVRSEDVDYPLSFNDTKSIEAVLSNNTALIEATLSGRLSLEQAQVISSLLETQHKIIVNSELEQRLTAMEEILIERKKNESR